MQRLVDLDAIKMRMQESQIALQVYYISKYIFYSLFLSLSLSHTRTRIHTGS